VAASGTAPSPPNSRVSPARESRNRAATASSCRTCPTVNARRNDPRRRRRHGRGVESLQLAAQVIVRLRRNGPRHGRRPSHGPRRLLAPSPVARPPANASGTSIGTSCRRTGSSAGTRIREDGVITGPDSDRSTRLKHDNDPGTRRVRPRCTAPPASADYDAVTPSLNEP